MNPREVTESFEREHLSEFASQSSKSRGRKRDERACEIRTAFQRDRDRIIHSKAFRRLMHKTQVFVSPEGDHYRTRLTHTLEVSQISRTIARALRLNEDLTEAIALGHDLGHSPFGHDGEFILDKLLPGGFEHSAQSVRVTERIENGGKGLNLTAEVLDGIRNHSLMRNPSTLEGHVVRLSDKIAYINHDIDDALRARILSPEDLPAEVLEILGEDSYSRINFLVRNTIHASLGKNIVQLEPGAYSAMLRLYDFMFERVYGGETKHRQFKKIEPIITKLHSYFCENPHKMPAEFQQMSASEETISRCVCDYIACMTDRFAIKTYDEIRKY